MMYGFHLPPITSMAMRKPQLMSMGIFLLYIAGAKLQKFGDTAKIISIVVRKLSVFTGFDGSWNHSNFAAVMKELKIETKWYDSDLNSMNDFSSSLHKYESPSTSSSWKKTLSSVGTWSSSTYSSSD